MAAEVTPGRWRRRIEQRVVEGERVRVGGRFRCRRTLA